MTIQALILLHATTDTATIGGLESVFDQKLFGLDPYTVFVFSICWSLFSCVRTHTNLIASEKGFCQVTTKLVIFAWGFFATLRRILSLVALFIPGLGLFSIFHHWRWEQIPFGSRLEYAKRGFLSSNDKIGLYGLNETIYWNEFDRWDYSDPQHPSPPQLNPTYTLLSLQETFIAGATLLALHFFLIMGVKVLTSPEFRNRGLYVNKIIHVIENLNYATPFCDWDEGDYTIQEFRARFRATCKEMTAALCINIICTLMMLVPLWYTG